MRQRDPSDQQVRDDLHGWMLRGDGWGLRSIESSRAVRVVGSVFGAFRAPCSSEPIRPWLLKGTPPSRGDRRIGGSALTKHGVTSREASLRVSVEMFPLRSCKSGDALGSTRVQGSRRVTGTPGVRVGQVARAAARSARRIEGRSGKRTRWPRIDERGMSRRIFTSRRSPRKSTTRIQGSSDGAGIA